MNDRRAPAVDPVVRLEMAAAASMGAAGEAVRAIASSKGVPAVRSTRVEAVVEELVRESFERESVAGSEAVTVEVAFDGASLWVTVRDHRLPLDLAEARHLASARLAALGFVDGLHVGFEGGAGNVVHVEVRLATGHDDSVQHESLDEEPTQAVVDAVVIRRMVPDDAPNLIRCIYRSYGYSYPDRTLYDVHALRRLVASEAMISVVAVMPDGEIVGHVALVYEEPGDRSPESGRLVVDPRLRGHRFTDRLNVRRSELAALTGIVGMWSKAVANHPISQRLAVSYGATEVGLLIGAQPTAVIQVGQPNPDAGWRSLMLLYRPASDIAPRCLVVPARYEPVFEELAGRLVIERSFDTTVRVPEPRRTSLRVHLQPEHGTAHLRMTTIGRDLRRRLIHDLRGLVLVRPEAIHVDVPLADPAAAWAAEELEHLGFCWAGWTPELTEAGDVLRLQRVGDHAVDLDHIETATDHGAAMRDFTIDEWHRVRRARLRGA